MGGQNVKAAKEAIDEGNIRYAAALALDYYDKGYKKSVYASRDESEIELIEFSEDNILNNALYLKDKI